ncbi:hypothetical protein IMSAGC001_02393 [Bacteroides acidifaciens]|uniref:Uncharacterized protein n=1 Tax=Bacteroides acidifaciens TaxID=85831 RepID=A0A7J0A4U3_9BACE|nr:hypothetical protein IMSAGC001_02393 [Bacteroides acidifaciens]
MSHLTQNGITQTKQTILAIFTNSCFFYILKIYKTYLDYVAKTLTKTKVLLYCNIVDRI